MLSTTDNPLSDNAELNVWNHRTGVAGNACHMHVTPDNQAIIDGIMIETERLTLRRWREEDAGDLFRYASDERVSALALWPCHTSVGMSLEVIRRFFMPNEETYAVVLKQTGEVVGCIGLVPEGEEHHAAVTGEREVGYWIGYPHWGKGLATEALMSLVPHWIVRLGLPSLLLTTDARNIGSQRVAEKCGFVKFDRYDLDGIASLAYRLTGV